MKSERMVTLVEPKLLAKINATAKRLKVSQAEVVRKALEAFLADAVYEKEKALAAKAR